MASVNDLRDDLPENDFTGYWLRQITRTAWHPVSEPPTEADGDKQGYILIWTENGLDMVKWDEEILEVPKPYVAEAMYWARIRDVVLLPPEEQE